MYDIKSVYKAKSVKDALQKMLEPDAIPISGGTDILVKLREGHFEGCNLISIHELPELTGVTAGDYGIEIKSATSFAEIAQNKIITNYIPALSLACDQVGSPQIRKVGTIGGNICNGAVSADSAPILLALNATLVLESLEGVREVNICEFYTGPGKTLRKNDELLTAIRIDKCNYEGFGGFYIKFGQRKALEIATVSCAVNLKLSTCKSKIEDYRIAFGVAGPTPIRCGDIEKQVVGMDADETLLEFIAQNVLKEVNPRDSWRASKAFRLQIIHELSKRVTARALENAGGQNA